MRIKLIRSAITVVSVLLVISLLFLVITIIEHYLSKAESTYVIVPDNYIREYSSDSSLVLNNNGARLLLLAESVFGLEDLGHTYASLLRFDGSKDSINKSFEVTNMFPGDKEERYYLACVSFKDYTILKFQARVRDGYEKLAEVMRIRVEQISENKVLYDGLMRDMPELTDTDLHGYGETTVDVYYKITAYLDTDVGNEYMNKELVADFYWWIDEAEWENEETTESTETTDESSESETTQESVSSESESETTDKASETETDTEQPSTSEEITTDGDHEHAPQTSDTTMLRIRLTVIVGIIALLMLLLVLLLMLGDKDNEKTR